MRWISKTKSIRDMEKKHIERKAELKALVDSLFEDERPTVDHSVVLQGMNDPRSLIGSSAMQMAALQNSRAFLLQQQNLAAMQNIGGMAPQAQAQAAYKPLLGGSLGNALSGLGRLV